MTTQDEINRYFTEQVIGGPVTLTLGASDNARQVSDAGLRIDGLTGRASRIATAIRTLRWHNTPAALAGTPLHLPSLVPLRRQLLVAALLLWSIALGGGLWALFTWMYTR